MDYLFSGNGSGIIRASQHWWQKNLLLKEDQYNVIIKSLVLRDAGQMANQQTELLENLSDPNYVKFCQDKV